MTAQYPCLAAALAVLAAILGKPAIALGADQAAGTEPRSAAGVELIAQHLRDARTKGNYGFQNVLAQSLADPVALVHGSSSTPVAKQLILDGGVADLEALSKAMPDFRNQIDDVSVQGDVVTLAYTWSGTTSDRVAFAAHKHAVMTVKDSLIVALAVQEDPNPESRKIISETFKKWKPHPADAGADQKAE